MWRNKSILLVSIFLLISTCLRSQIRLSGWVKDSITGEVLIGSHIFEKGTTNAVSSDNHGYFSILAELPVFIEISFIGYKQKTVHITGRNDTLISVLLVAGTDLDEVIVKAQRNKFLSSVSISRRDMLLTPALGATPDVLKTIQLQPGIQSQNEGSSLLLVRGGNPGENLYLLDGVPLIYVNHLGGFMSVFNPEMINNLTLYKGGFPSKYGGKLSSIVDITQREGNITGFKGSLGLGLTDGSFCLEGPIKSKKLTYILSGRKTFTDLPLLAASKIGDGDYLVSYGFHDINAKISWRPDDRNSAHLNLYQGDDYLNSWYAEEYNGVDERSTIGNTWGNWMAAVRWNRVISSRLFLTNNFSYTRYRLKYKNIFSFETLDQVNESVTEYLSSVQDISLRSDWRFKALRILDLEYGIQSTYAIHNPSERIHLESGSSDGLQRIGSLEASIYLDNVISIKDHSRIRTGLRWVNYFTQNYRFHSLEPRVTCDINLGRNHQLNFSYMRVSQNSHLLFASQSFLNNEIWIPADSDVSSATSDQIAAGWNLSLDQDMYQAGFEIYYKILSNLSTYREGYANILGDENWKSKIETGGLGKGYGFELLLRKTRGRLNGYLSYTYSRSFRQYEGINNGFEYIFEYDRPHSGSVNINYEINNKLMFSVAWIYQTGLPYTPAIARQYTQSMEYREGADPFYYETLIYGDRNSDRMKDYHRLDVALVYSRITKKRKLNSSWTFSVYNLYNRQNPYYYYYNHKGGPEVFPPNPYEPFKPVFLYQISFFPVIPSVSYKVYFDADSFKRTGEKENFKKRLTKWLFYEK